MELTSRLMTFFMPEKHGSAKKIDVLIRHAIKPTKKEKENDANDNSNNSNDSDSGNRINLFDN